MFGKREKLSDHGVGQCVFIGEPRTGNVLVLWTGYGDEFEALHWARAITDNPKLMVLAARTMSDLNVDSFRRSQHSSRIEGNWFKRTPTIKRAIRLIDTELRDQMREEIRQAA